MTTNTNTNTSESNRRPTSAASLYFRYCAIRRAVQDCSDETKAALQAAIDPDISLGNRIPMRKVYIAGLDRPGIPLTHAMCCGPYEMGDLANLVRLNRDAVAAIPGAEGVLRAMDEAPAETLKGLRDICCDSCPHDWRTASYGRGCCELCAGCPDEDTENGIESYCSAMNTLDTLTLWIERYRPSIKDAAIIEDFKALCRSLSYRYPWDHVFDDLAKSL